MVYKTLIASGKYPFVVLNIEIPTQDVDVNVHPTKKEVRYKNTNQIFNFVRTSVEGGLANFIEQEFKPIPHIEEKIIEFTPVQQEIRIDQDDDTMYVSENLMQKLQEQIIHHEPVVEQQSMILQTEYKEPEPEENIIGQYKNTYIFTFIQ